MSGFTGLVLREGRFVRKKMCGFRNIQVRVDGGLKCLMLHSTCKQSNMLRVPDTFSIHFPFLLLFFSCFLLCCFLLFFLLLLVLIFLFDFSCHGLCFWNSHIKGVVFIS